MSRDMPVVGLTMMPTVARVVAPNAAVSCSVSRYLT
jgi:hypothetical protein